MTQEGLAAAAWVELRHLSQYLRPLLAEELVRERTCHVKGIRQRRRVYDLTESGQHAAYRLRDRTRSEQVTVRDASGTREETLGRVLEEVGTKGSLLDLVRRSMQSGTVDLEVLAAAPASAYVERIGEAPHLDHFVGRQAELLAMTADGDGPRIFVIRGVAGIGKSSIAARVCELLRGHRNLFWHTLRPWDTRISVLADLGEFLSALGRPGLRSVVARGEASEAAAVLREDLPGTRSLLVFDDAHDAAPEVVALFRFLKDAIADAADVESLILSRRTVGFYDRRDVSLRRLVREIDLAGLTREDIADFLDPDVDPAARKWATSLGGHPLLLQLIRSLPHAPTQESALRDMRRFLEEEVYGELTDPERSALKAASLYRVPVPVQALQVDPAITHDTLLSLTNRSLLRPVGPDGLELHDSIRSYFAGILTPSELSALGGFASGALRALASAAKASGNDGACIDFLSNALALPSTAEAREDLLEDLADLHERIGDFPAALTEFKEAQKVAASPETRARLHRKTASAFEARGDLAAAAKELESSRAALGGAGGVEEGWIGLVASRLALHKSDFGGARSLGQKALDCFERHKDAQGLVRTRYALGNLEIEDPRGDPVEAERQFLAGLELAAELGDAEREVRLRIGLAHLYANRLADLPRAMEQVHAIEANDEGLRDPQTRRSFLMLQSWIHLEIRADYPAAERSFHEAAALARKIHFMSSIPAARYGLALSEYYQGRVSDARRDLEEFAQDSEALGFPGWSVEALSVVAECDLRLGDVDRFRQVLRDLARPELAAGSQARPGRVKIVEAADRVLRDDLDGARVAFDEALRLAGQGQPTEQALELHLVHFYCGIALRVCGRRQEGEEHLRESREYLERAHLNARLSILPDAERELAACLAQAGRSRAG